MTKYYIHNTQTHETSEFNDRSLVVYVRRLCEKSDHDEPQTAAEAWKLYCESFRRNWETCWKTD